MNGYFHVESTYLLVSYLIADFDNIRGDTIVKYFDGLRSLCVVFWHE